MTEILSVGISYHKEKLSELVITRAILGAKATPHRTCALAFAAGGGYAPLLFSLRLGALYYTIKFDKSTPRSG